MCLLTQVLVEIRARLQIAALEAGDVEQQTQHEDHGLNAYVVAIHIVETIALAVTQLKPLNVPALSGLWWKWVVLCQ
jgi:hypothetical protein